MSFELSAILLSWIVIALLALIVAGLVRQVHQLQTGRTAAVTPLGVQAGQRLEPQDLTPLGIVGRAVLLFVEPDCVTCREILADARWPTEGVHLLTRASGLPSNSPARKHEQQDTMFEKLQVNVTPLAVVLEDTGLVSRVQPVGSVSEFEALLAWMRKVK